MELYIPESTFRGRGSREAPVAQRGRQFMSWTAEDVPCAAD
jgi:hypothetical protein